MPDLRVGVAAAGERAPDSCARAAAALSARRGTPRGACNRSAWRTANALLRSMRRAQRAPRKHWPTRLCVDGGQALKVVDAHLQARVQVSDDEALRAARVMHEACGDWRERPGAPHTGESACPGSARMAWWCSASRMQRPVMSRRGARVLRSPRQHTPTPGYILQPSTTFSAIQGPRTCLG